MQFTRTHCSLNRGNACTNPVEYTGHVLTNCRSIFTGLSIQLFFMNTGVQLLLCIHSFPLYNTYLKHLLCAGHCSNSKDKTRFSCKLILKQVKIQGNMKQWKPYGDVLRKGAWRNDSMIHTSKASVYAAKNLRTQRWLIHMPTVFCFFFFKC